MRSFVYRPKGPQRSQDPLKIRRTNWEGAGPGSAYMRFWPSKSNAGSRIDFYNVPEGIAYVMTDRGIRRIAVDASPE